MAAVTAEYSASLRVPRADENPWRPEKAALVERYMRRHYLVNQVVRARELHTPSQVSGPSLNAPAWLSAVEQRIRASTRFNLAASVSRGEADGHWLTKEVADAAIAFFRKSADLLPGEPYIYSSRQGELIAEFGSRDETLTGVISSEWVILFANVRGTPVERTLRPQEIGATALRAAVRDIDDMLRAGHHGKVGAKR